MKTIPMAPVPRILSRLYQVSVSNRQDRLAVDKKKLIAVVRHTLCVEKVAAAEISVALLDDPTIHQINLEYLNHDYPPDVLSFVLEEEGGVDPESAPSRSKTPVSETPRGAGKTLSGEILLGVEEAQRGGKQYGWPAEHELLLYLVHGLLHICGYDDTTPTERKIMRRREREVLAEWGLTPPTLQRTAAQRTLPGKKPASSQPSSPRKRSAQKTSVVESRTKGTRKVARRGGKTS